MFYIMYRNNMNITNLNVFRLLNAKKLINKLNFSATDNFHVFMFCGFFLSH